MTQLPLSQPQTPAEPNSEQVTSAEMKKSSLDSQQPPIAQDQQASEEASAKETDSAPSKRPDQAKIAANLLLFEKLLVRAEAEETRDRFIDKYGCTPEQDS